MPVCRAAPQSCQRYWTAGGTLRNVPPGSGRRKSKSQSKSDSQGEKPAPTSSGSLADQLAKQTAASALLSNPAQLAASVPFLNPMLAESTLLAYNAAAQQSRLGALAAKMPVAGSQWPSGLNGNGAVADTAASLASPSANGGTSSNHGLQMPNGAGTRTEPHPPTHKHNTSTQADALFSSHWQAARTSSQAAGTSSQVQNSRRTVDDGSDRQLLYLDIITCSQVTTCTTASSPPSVSS